MGTRIGRSTLFGIALQQQWSYANSGDFAPTYYLETDAPLYYYSFTDAYIASVYRSLSPAEQTRFDPMITDFNPADMYGVDHIRRVLEVFPGVFTGIGEFSIHKATQFEIVESIVAGPELRHVNFDISWDEVAKYAIASKESIARVARMLNTHPDRVLFGTDTVAPATPEPYFAVFDMWAPVWAQLTPEASLNVRKGNYQRLFDEGRRKVCAWEKAHVKWRRGSGNLGG
jgi:hypothetical protein